MVSTGSTTASLSFKGLVTFQDGARNFNGHVISLLEIPSQNKKLILRLGKIV
jgi:hypothetical protein